MRHRKGRDVLEDVRPVIRSIDVHDDTTVDMELHTQPRSAKPGEVLAAIGGITEVRALRTHQWIERDGARLEPLDADTITVGFATAGGGMAAAAGGDSSRPYAPEGAYVMREGIDVRSGTSRGRDERAAAGHERDERRSVVVLPPEAAESSADAATPAGNGQGGTAAPRKKRRRGSRGGRRRRKPGTQGRRQLAGRRGRMTTTTTSKTSKTTPRSRAARTTPTPPPTAA